MISSVDGADGAMGLHRTDLIRVAEPLPAPSPAIKARDRDKGRRTAFEKFLNRIASLDPVKYAQFCPAELCRGPDFVPSNHPLQFGSVEDCTRHLAQRDRRAVRPASEHVSGMQHVQPSLSEVPVLQSKFRRCRLLPQLQAVREERGSLRQSASYIFMRSRAGAVQPRNSRWQISYACRV
jgi:hypothetical protein